MLFTFGFLMKRTKTEKKVVQRARLDFIVEFFLLRTNLIVGI